MSNIFPDRVSQMDGFKNSEFGLHARLVRRDFAKPVLRPVGWEAVHRRQTRATDNGPTGQGPSRGFLVDGGEGGGG